MLNIFAEPKFYNLSVKFAVLFAAAILLLSCSKSTNLEEDIHGNLITFSTNVGDFTRAVSTFGPINLNTLQSSTDGFTVSTSGLGTNMNNVAVTYNTSTRFWGYTGNYYWPSIASQNVSFTAYAPAGTSNVTLTSSGLTITAFTPATTPSNQIDIIYAPPANFNRSGSGTAGVVLTFKHLLTQVVFAVVTDIPSSSSPVVNSVQLAVPQARGSYNGTSWNTTSNARTFTVFSQNAINSTAISSTPLLLVPTGVIHENTNAKINFTARGVAYSREYDLSKLKIVTTWDAGYRVTYTIQIKQADLQTRSSADGMEVNIEASQQEGY